MKGETTWQDNRTGKRSELTVFVLGFFFVGLAQFVLCFDTDWFCLSHDPAAPGGDGCVIIETESKSHHGAAPLIGLLVCGGYVQGFRVKASGDRSGPACKDLPFGQIVRGGSEDFGNLWEVFLVRC